MTLPLRAADLTGKDYLRAWRAGATLDWLAFWASCRWHHGLPLLELAAILRQKAQVGRPADLAVVR